MVREALLNPARLNVVPARPMVIRARRAGFKVSSARVCQDLLGLACDLASGATSLAPPKLREGEAGLARC